MIRRASRTDTCLERVPTLVPSTSLNTVLTEYRTIPKGSCSHTVKQRAFGEAGFLPADPLPSNLEFLAPIGRRRWSVSVTLCGVFRVLCSMVVACWFCLYPRFIGHLQTKRSDLISRQSSDARRPPLPSGLTILTLSAPPHLRRLLRSCSIK